MPQDKRSDQIVAVVDERGYVSVKELSKILDVSEVTIRRDLQQLDDDKRIRKMYGGAVTVRSNPAPVQPAAANAPQEGSLVDRVDVLITTSVDPQFDRALIDRADNRHVPVIAESTRMNGASTVVSVENYAAGMALGVWAGRYALQHFDGVANALDLSFELSNTLERSKGFAAGLREAVPSAQVVLSINAQSRYQVAYQLAADALKVHPNINIIFAINDTTAWGAITACQDLGRDPASVLVLTFGLEGNTLRDALVAGAAGYCKAGLAMFPEIVAPVCIQAAVDVSNGKPMPPQLVTPHEILTPDTLTELYQRTETGWQLRWDRASRLKIPCEIGRNADRAQTSLPKRIGFVVPFIAHDWYRNLVVFMREYAAFLGIEFETVDAAQTTKDDVALRQRAIAEMAASRVKPGDVLLIDGGEITTYLAQELAGRENITVITNSLPVFEILRTQGGVTLISTGGSLRRSSNTLIGPTTEAALRELRADKLFLNVSGISLDFGLSHTNLAEAAVKQAMLRAAREVFLLADHTRFGQDSVMQIAPVTAIHKLITDNALPASVRLELSKLGIEVMLAET
ncbi:MAG: substrate-binding domain-containing protein [Chloroflexi bacterium]|nr:substrate-binding domain-containing protein [Chloroflexota bacterium]